MIDGEDSAECIFRFYHEVIWQKTMVQAQGPAEDVPPSLRVCGQDVECVDEFTYLGVLIHSSCSSEPEIRRQCAMTRTAMQKLDHRLWRSRIATSTKLNSTYTPHISSPSCCTHRNAGQSTKQTYFELTRWTSGACKESLASNGRIS